ncbi:MAG TPA: SAM-dependent methyltransferase [Pyrinomonadaceae bacterium]|nr:SAM-dependent methyltransferase [Pyrinomonadaceae bacterium]
MSEISSTNREGDGVAKARASGSDAERFVETLRASLERKTFVKLTLGKYRGDEAGLKNVYVRALEIKKKEHLSFLYRYQTKDTVKNFPFAEGVELVLRLLGSTFLSGHLFTSEQDLQIEFNRKRESRLVSRPPTFTQPPPTAHDRKKERLIEVRDNVYLQALGVTNERGEVREKMGDKFRQINKFVEVVGGLFASSPLAERREISIVDMGSGKGYLTFAVYDYFNNTLGIKANVVGVEAREELAGLCNDIAERAGFDKLRFRTGYIHETELEKTDILIALHACDTATDDALFKGIAAGASVIITAPCCHKQVRPQIRTPAPLESMLRHGHLLERQAEMVTDSLRALLLEHSGYRTKVFEFISTDHTRKNTMIAAVRQSREVDKEAALRQFQNLKEFYGIREQRLEQLLCENFWA